MQSKFKTSELSETNMNPQLIDFQTAENDLLACAVYLTQKIGSSDGYAEVVKELVPYYLSKDNVDMAAQLADSVEDTFIRDRLLVDVAEKCAQIDDDEYGVQLADAIEDVGLRATAFERLAVQKAVKNDFEKSFRYIDSLNHPSDAMAAIAVRQMIGGDQAGALKTIAEIEAPLSKVNAFQEIGEMYLQKGENAKAVSFLDNAYQMAEEIDFNEEKIRTLILLSTHFTEAERKDRAIEILAETQAIAETLPGFNRENFLANVSLGFLRAGSVDLADRALDLVANKTLIASALTGFSTEFDKNGEREEALETLDEAYAILKSEQEKEIRDSRGRFGIMTSIAVNFANFNQPERAIEIALENPYETERHSALKQIARINVTNKNDEAARQVIGVIDDASEKIFGLIGMSDDKQKSGDKDEALTYLNEAFAHVADVKQHFLRSLTFNWLIVKFYEQDEKEKARDIGLENLQTIPRILDESHKAIALANLAKIYEDLEFELNSNEKEVLKLMLRKSEW